MHGWSDGAIALRGFQCRGILLIWIIVGQGLSVLAVRTDGGCLDILSLFYHFSFSFFLPDPIYTEILSQKAVDKPKTTKQRHIDRHKY